MPAAPPNLCEGLTALKRSVTSDISSPEQFEQYLERYAMLGGAVEELRQKNIISPLPDSEPAGSSDYAHSRIRTIRNRLFNLGYLKFDSKEVQLDETLKSGIAGFQSDAAETIGDFTVDGWVGEQTWTALQELVSFEETSNIPRWFKDGEACPALIRATWLRLFTLGLIGDKPGQDLGDMGPALRQFSKICRILELTSGHVRPEICPETISLIFDQDGLVKQLAKCTAPTTKAVRMIIHGFVMSLAKIELWLLGFAVEPNGSKQEISASLNKSMILEKESPLYKALYSFWVLHKGDQSKATMPARLFVNSSFPLFFAQLLKDTTTEVEQMDADEVYDCLKEYHISLDTVWEHVKAFGSRLWDGLKRIWGWFRNIVRKVASAVSSFIKNISCLAYQYMLHSYETVKAVIRGFCDSVSYLVSAELKVPEHVKTVIRHDADFDFKILVHEEDKPADVTASVEAVKIRSRIFNISSRILAALINVLKYIATGFAGPEWLLMGLLKLHKRITRLAPELIELQKCIPA